MPFHIDDNRSIRRQHESSHAVVVEPDHVHRQVDHFADAMSVLVSGSTDSSPFMSISLLFAELSNEFVDVVRRPRHERGPGDRPGGISTIARCLELVSSSWRLGAVRRCLEPTRTFGQGILVGLVLSRPCQTVPSSRSFETHEPSECCPVPPCANEFLG